jgi:thermostable 8-oxoguanine DNA glycosylase
MEVALQEVWAGFGETARLMTLPSTDTEVMPGVPWGSAGYFNTPAYWAVRCGWEDQNPDFVTRNSLLRETVFCLLGGYGVRYEVNAAAHERVEQEGFFEEPLGTFSEAEIRSWLLEPLLVEGRRVRYRFPNQRAARIAGMCKFRHIFEASDLGANALREALMAIDGIGPKTASWIVRNCLGSDDVAIIDIHLVRACQHMALFPQKLKLPRDYAALEEKFLRFSRAIAVRPSVLDAVMWSVVRKAPSLTAGR